MLHICNLFQLVNIKIMLINIISIYDLFQVWFFGSLGTKPSQQCQGDSPLGGILEIMKKQRSQRQHHMWKEKYAMDHKILLSGLIWLRIRIIGEPLCHGIFGFHKPWSQLVHPKSSIRQNISSYKKISNNSLSWLKMKLVMHCVTNQNMTIYRTSVSSKLVRQDKIRITLAEMKFLGRTSKYT